MAWWYPEMTRVIFDYIDEQKGEQSRFITDRNGAFEDIRRNLEPKTIDKKVYASINKKKIQNKMMQQAARGGIGWVNIQSLFVHGTSVLRLGKMQENVFTGAEIADSEKRHGADVSQANHVLKRKNDTHETSVRKRLRLNPTEPKAESKMKPAVQKRKASEDPEEDFIPAKKKRLKPSVKSESSTKIQTRERTQKHRPLDTRCRRCQEKDLQCDLKFPCSNCKVERTACKYPNREKTVSNVNEENEGDIVAQTSASIDVHRAGHSKKSKIKDSPDSTEGNIPLNALAAHVGHDVRSPGISQRSESNSKVSFTCDVCGENFHGKDDMLQHRQELHGKDLQNHSFICSAPECYAWFETVDLLKIHTKAHDELVELRALLRPNGETPETREAAKWIALMNNIRPDEKCINLIRLMKADQAAEHIDVDLIKKEMQHIQMYINTATTDFLYEYDIDNLRDNPVFDFASYEGSLVELLTTMYGAGSLKSPHVFEKRMALPDQELQVVGFVMGLIGAAVTRWALLPIPQGHTEDGVLGELNIWLASQSKSLQSNALQIAVREYLRKSIKPKLSKYAHTMATEMLHLLRHFVPLESHKTRSLWPQQVSALSASDLQNLEENDSSLSPSSPPPSHSKSANITQYPPRPPEDPKEVFLNTLSTEIFERALNLRVAMEMQGNAKYSFFFPRSGSALRFDEHITHLKTSKEVYQDSYICRDAGISYDHSKKERKRTPARTVLLGLTPRVEGRFRDRRDGRWNEQCITVCKGRVNLWEPNEERDLASQPEEEDDDDDDDDDEDDDDNDEDSLHAAECSD